MSVKYLRRCERPGVKAWLLTMLIVLGLTAGGAIADGPEPTPVATINFADETLEDFVDGSAYTVNGQAITLDGTTSVINEAWIGTTVEIVTVSRGAPWENSIAQSLAIPARPSAPSPVTENSGFGENNGKITGVTNEMEWRVSGGNWADVIGTEVENLSPGVYEARVKATASAFAGVTATVTVVEDDDPAPVEDAKTALEGYTWVIDQVELNEDETQADIKDFVQALVDDILYGLGTDVIGEVDEEDLETTTVSEGFTPGGEIDGLFKFKVNLSKGTVTGVQTDEIELTIKFTPYAYTRAENLNITPPTASRAVDALSNVSVTIANDHATSGFTDMEISFVSVEKNSEGAITVPADIAELFTLGALSATTIAAEANITFDLTPVDGLEAEADYTVIIKVDGKNADGQSVTKNYTLVLTVEEAGTFYAVTGITGVPAAGTFGTPLALTGTVVPEHATNKGITWSVQTAGTTGATIASGNMLSTTSTGDVVVRATITNGAGATTNYTQDFTIAISLSDSAVLANVIAALGELESEDWEVPMASVTNAAAGNTRAESIINAVIAELTIGGVTVTAATNSTIPATGFTAAVAGTLNGTTTNHGHGIDGSHFFTATLSRGSTPATTRTYSNQLAIKATSVANPWAGTPNNLDLALIPEGGVGTVTATGRFNLIYTTGTTGTVRIADTNSVTISGTKANWSVEVAEATVVTFANDAKIVGVTNAPALNIMHANAVTIKTEESDTVEAITGTRGVGIRAAGALTIDADIRMITGGYVSAGSSGPRHRAIEATSLVILGGRAVYAQGGVTDALRNSLVSTTSSGVLFTSASPWAALLVGADLVWDEDWNDLLNDATAGDPVTITFAQGAKLTVPEGVTMDIPEHVTITIREGSELIIEGDVDFDGGTMTVLAGATVTVEEDGKLEIKGGTVNIRSGAEIVNNGEVEIHGAGTVFTNNGTFTNNGDVDVDQHADLGGTGRINNTEGADFVIHDDNQSDIVLSYQVLLERYPTANTTLTARLTRAGTAVLHEGYVREGDTLTFAAAVTGTLYDVGTWYVNGTEVTEVDVVVAGVKVISMYSNLLTLKMADAAVTVRHEFRDPTPKALRDDGLEFIRPSQQPTGVTPVPGTFRMATNGEVRNFTDINLVSFFRAIPGSPTVSNLAYAQILVAGQTNRAESGRINWTQGTGVGAGRSTGVFTLDVLQQCEGPSPCEDGWKPWTTDTISGYSIRIGYLNPGIIRVTSHGLDAVRSGPVPVKLVFNTEEYGMLTTEVTLITDFQSQFVLTEKDEHGDPVQVANTGVTHTFYADDEEKINVVYGGYSAPDAKEFRITNRTGIDNVGLIARITNVNVPAWYTLSTAQTAGNTTFPFVITGTGNSKEEPADITAANNNFFRQWNGLGGQPDTVAVADYDSEEYQIFSVQPRTGLPAGTYSFTLEILQRDHDGRCGIIIPEQCPVFDPRMPVTAGAAATNRLPVSVTYSFTVAPRPISLKITEVGNHVYDRTSVVASLIASGDSSGTLANDTVGVRTFVKWAFEDLDLPGNSGFGTFTVPTGTYVRPQWPAGTVVRTVEYGEEDAEGNIPVLGHPVAANPADGEGSEGYDVIVASTVATAPVLLRAGTSTAAANANIWRNYRLVTVTQEDNEEGEPEDVVSAMVASDIEYASKVKILRRVLNVNVTSGINLSSTGSKHYDGTPKAMGESGVGEEIINVLSINNVLATSFAAAPHNVITGDNVSLNSSGLRVIDATFVNNEGGVRIPDIGTNIRIGLRFGGELSITGSEEVLANYTLRYTRTLEDIQCETEGDHSRIGGEDNNLIQNITRRTGDHLRGSITRRPIRIADGVVVLHEKVYDGRDSVFVNRRDDVAVEDFSAEESKFFAVSTPIATSEILRDSLSNNDITLGFECSNINEHDVGCWVAQARITGAIGNLDASANEDTVRYNFVTAEHGRPVSITGAMLIVDSLNTSWPAIEADWIERNTVANRVLRNFVLASDPILTNVHVVPNNQAAYLSTGARGHLGVFHPASYTFEPGEAGTHTFAIGDLLDVTTSANPIRRVGRILELTTITAVKHTLDIAGNRVGTGATVSVTQNLENSNEWVVDGDYTVTVNTSNWGVRVSTEETPDENVEIVITLPFVAQNYEELLATASLKVIRPQDRFVVNGSTVVGSNYGSSDLTLIYGYSDTSRVAREIRLPVVNEKKEVAAQVTASLEGDVNAFELLVNGTASPLTSILNFMGSMNVSVRPRAGLNAGYYSAVLNITTTAETDADDDLDYTHQIGLTVSPIDLRVDFTTLTLTGRMYDATRNVTVSTPGLIGVTAGTGVITGDDVSLDWAEINALFVDKHVGTAKPVSFTGTLALTGADAVNYRLVTIMSEFNTPARTAAITQRPVFALANGVTVGTPSVMYNGSVDARRALTIAADRTVELVDADDAAETGIIEGDVVTVIGGVGTVNAVFEDKNVASNKPITVTITGVTLGGADGGNYAIQPIDNITGLTASVTQRPIELRVNAFNTLNSSNNPVADVRKAYDGTTDISFATQLSATAAPKFVNGGLNADRVSLQVPAASLPGETNLNPVIGAVTGGVWTGDDVRLDFTNATAASIGSAHVLVEGDANLLRSFHMVDVPVLAGEDKDNYTLIMPSVQGQNVFERGLQIVKASQQEFVDLGGILAGHEEDMIVEFGVGAPRTIRIPYADLLPSFPAGGAHPAFGNGTGPALLTGIGAVTVRNPQSAAPFYTTSANVVFDSENREVVITTIAVHAEFVGVKQFVDFAIESDNFVNMSASITLVPDYHFVITNIAEVEIDGEFVYNNGDPVVPAANQISVTYEGRTLVAGTDYTVSATNNINVGTATVTITGAGDYRGTVTSTFVIEAMTPIAGDFDVTLPENAVYNGQPHAATVTLPGIRHGAITVSYRDADDVVSTTAPSTVGTYTVLVSVAAYTGTNAANYLPVTGIVVGNFTIGTATEATPAVTINFANETLTGFVAERNYTVNGTAVVLDGTTLDISDALFGTTAEIVTVARNTNYANSAAQSLVILARPATPSVSASAADTNSTNSGVITGVTAAMEYRLVGAASWTAVTGTSITGLVSGNYEVRVAATTDAFASAVATATIGTVGVNEGNRDLPVDGDIEVIVVPTVPVSGEFTVGPNVVAKSDGSVTLYWNGKALAAGTLNVFDATGNLITTVDVSDVSSSSDRRAIGAWNLTDRSGRPVAEGTYLIRGVLTAKDGSTQRVSSIVVVR